MVQLHHLEVEKVLGRFLGLKSVVAHTVVQVAQSLVELRVELAIYSVLESELLGHPMPSKRVK